MAASRYFVTVSETYALCVTVLPFGCPVPLIVSVKVPRLVFRLVVTASVDVPGATTDAGLKVAVAAFGAPVTPSATGPEKPPTELTVTV